LEAEIVLNYKSVREAEAVANAISPDNLKAPQGLKVKTTQRGNKVVNKIQCDTKLQTFMATIDDLLSAVSVAERVLSAAKT
jgi:tRNA threonylcarbamoyladenosine modification (KEOPS) complex  Pcc1 subunit